MIRFFNRPLRVLLFTDSAVLLAGAMILPIYAVYVEDIGGDILDAGFAASIFAVAAGVSALVAGKLSDRIKRKERFVAAAYLVMAIGFLLYMFVNSIWTLCAVQVLIGLAQAGYAPAFDALYGSNISSQKKASSRWSAWEAGYYFSTALGSVAGAAIVHIFGFDSLFVIMSALCVLSGAYLYTRPRRIFTEG